MSNLFWYAVGVCCLQAICLHHVLKEAPPSIWLCLSVASLTPLLNRHKTPVRWSARVIVDCLFDTASLIVPTIITHVYPCAGSLTMATLFRSLAMPLVALLKGDFARLPEALIESLVLTVVARQRSTQCQAEPESTVLIVVGLFSATLATAILSVRQRVEQTWPATNLARVPVFVCLLWLTSDSLQIDEVPFYYFSLYFVCSILASRAVMAYNTSVNQDAYFKTRMLSTRRLISALLGLVVLDNYTPVAICIAAGLLVCKIFA